LKGCVEPHCPSLRSGASQLVISFSLPVPAFGQLPLSCTSTSFRCTLFASELRLHPSHNPINTVRIGCQYIGRFANAVLLIGFA
jgi:hypothetical protein